MSPPPPPPRNFFEKIASHMYPVHISSRSSLAKRGGGNGVPRIFATKLRRFWGAASALGKRRSTESMTNWTSKLWRRPRGGDKFVFVSPLCPFPTLPKEIARKRRRKFADQRPEMNSKNKILTPPFPLLEKVKMLANFPFLPLFSAKS